MKGRPFEGRLQSLDDLGRENYGPKPAEKESAPERRVSNRHSGKLIALALAGTLLAGGAIGYRVGSMSNYSTRVENTRPDRIWIEVPADVQIPWMRIEIENFYTTRDGVELVEDYSAPIHAKTLQSGETNIDSPEENINRVLGIIDYSTDKR